MAEVDVRRVVVYVGLALVVCVLGARYVASREPAAPAPPRVTEAKRPSVALSRNDGGRATVHVAGAVREPGVYRLRAGERVDDAVRRAGGPTGEADLSAINLAAKVEDGRQVLVPVKAESRADGASAAAPGGGAPPGVREQPVNLNTATLEQLDALDGIGPGIAEKILAYREEHGGFRSVDELAQVPGIGEKRLAALREAVTA